MAVSVNPKIFAASSAAPDGSSTTAGATPLGIRKLEGLSMVALLVLVFIIPGASAALFRAAATVSLAAGLDPAALNYGWKAFHFWQ